MYIVHRECCDRWTNQMRVFHGNVSFRGYKVKNVVLNDVCSVLYRRRQNLIKFGMYSTRRRIYIVLQLKILRIDAIRKQILNYDFSLNPFYRFWSTFKMPPIRIQTNLFFISSKIAGSEVIGKNIKSLSLKEGLHKWV